MLYTYEIYTYYVTYLYRWSEDIYTQYMLDGHGWHYLFSQRILYTIHIGWPWVALSFQSEDIIHYTYWMAMGGIIFSVRGHYTLYILDGHGWHYLFSQRILYTIHVGWPWVALSFQSEDIIHYTCRMAMGGIIFSVRGHYTLYILDGHGWHYLFSQRTLYTIHIGWPWVALSFQSEDIIHYTYWMAMGGIIFSVRGYYTLYMLDGHGWHYPFGIDIYYHVTLYMYICRWLISVYRCEGGVALYMYLLPFKCEVYICLTHLGDKYI